MKKILIVVALFTCFLTIVLCSSCSKEKDDADAIVGTYIVTGSESVVWGAASRTLAVNGDLIISKTGPNTFRTSGFLDVTGTVYDNRVTFNTSVVSDTGGSITTSFSAATYNDGVMYFSIYRNGNLKDKGVSYPFSSTAAVRAVKVNR